MFPLSTLYLTFLSYHLKNFFLKTFNDFLLPTKSECWDAELIDIINFLTVQANINIFYRIHVNKIFCNFKFQ